MDSSVGTLEYDHERNTFRNHEFSKDDRRATSINLSQESLAESAEASQCCGCSYTNSFYETPMSDEGVDVRPGIWHRVLRWSWGIMSHENCWVFLALLGVTSSVLAWTIDEVVDLIVRYKADVAKSAANSVVGYLLWTLFSAILAVTAVLATQYISPLAAGSGIPQMRSLLGGFAIPDYLAVKTLVAKVVGLMLALGSGMVIGKEGPFVHISCIIGNQMLRLPVFHELASSVALRKQILAAACAVGVSSTFGAPIGGVLFSIEVTGTYFESASVVF